MWSMFVLCVIFHLAFAKSEAFGFTFICLVCHFKHLLFYNTSILKLITLRTVEASSVIYRLASPSILPCFDEKTK